MRACQEYGRSKEREKFTSVDDVEVGKSAFTKSSLIGKDVFGLNDSHSFDVEKTH